MATTSIISYNMTISEYFKLAIRHKYLIITVTLAALASGLFIANNNQSLRFNNTIFYIFSVKDPARLTDTYENLQAADQITESIQGWFKDPAFLNNINIDSQLAFGLKSKKQEKNNLIITFNSDNETNGTLYGQAINQNLFNQINAYNANSDLQIQISRQSLNQSPKPNELGLYLLISLIIGLFLGYIASFLYEILRSKLKSTTELQPMLGDKNVLTFNSHKHLKTDYHFLIKYLENTFNQESLQILDLTSKSKIGIEVLSKHSKFHLFKSYDIPRELDKVNLSLPTLILAELGYTSTKDLQQLAKLNFKNIEVVLLNHL